ncbi:hypothetical protein [Hydrocoleum sp. CS-953]|nr:hypothetical protein [Hydrocoleum sp. CS-953]
MLGSTSSCFSYCASKRTLLDYEDYSDRVSGTEFYRSFSTTRAIAFWYS